MSDILTKDIAVLRIVIVKEKKDYFIGKDFSGNRYKLLKNEDSRHIKVGDDRYVNVERLGRTLLFNNVLRLLNKNEEYKLTATNEFSSLAELGISAHSL